VVQVELSCTLCISFQGEYCLTDEFTLFEELAAETYTVFQDKARLALTYVPEQVVGRVAEERVLAAWLVQGVRDRYLPAMIRVYGPPGGGKTVVTRSVLRRFQTFRSPPDFAHVYVNVKQCRTAVSAANAILAALTGQHIAPTRGLDAIFTRLWAAVTARAAAGIRFLVLVLDEVDAIFQDKHYDPSDFLYRFLRYRQAPSSTELQLCLVVITNNSHMFEATLDGRVRSSMGDHVLLFPRYSPETLEAILQDRVGQAFRPGVVDDGFLAILAGQGELDGDARKAIGLLRVCGELATERREPVTDALLSEAMTRWTADAHVTLLASLSLAEQAILASIATLTQDTVSTTFRTVYTHLQGSGASTATFGLGESRLREILQHLAATGLVAAWHRSRGRYGARTEVALNLDADLVLQYYQAQSL
jgi:orc1/cdc6 family replication initiation protein